MWLAILTPGAHPSRLKPTPEATVFAWTPDDRRRIDGPFAAVHGGLRVTRRLPCPVPDLPASPGLRDVEELVAPVTAARPPAPGSALLALVRLDPLDGPGDRPLDEEVLVVLPGRPLALLTPLERVPDTLSLLAAADTAEPLPACSGCGTVLPGSDAQRAEHERTAGRPAPLRRRRGSHRRDAA